MKHRSVIAFVIVAAALFSLPQLSHDLRELKGEVGARLHRELLSAFLSLPAGEPVAAEPAVTASSPLLASCQTERPAAKRVRAAKGEATERTSGKDFEQGAMIDNPANDPINHTARVEVKVDGVKAAAGREEVKVAEVAMIIPPETGIDPRAVAAALKSSDIARVDADRLRVEAEGVRVAYAARFDAKGVEREANEEAVRRLNRSLPGAYEFRLVREGAKGAKVLKVKCGDCPAGAPRAPRQPPAPAPLPAPFNSAEWSAGE